MARKKQNNDWLIVAGVILVLFLLSRRYGGKTVDVSSDFIIEAYRDLITLQSDNINYQGVPLHIYLARNTTDYDTVKYAYNSTYGGNFTQELTSRLAGQRLVEYVAELLKNGQLITP
jgi:hypothetical protein